MMKLWKVAECAADGNCSSASVYRAAALGEIEVIRIGSRGIRVPEQSWRKYLEARRRPAIERDAVAAHAESGAA